MQQYKILIVDNDPGWQKIVLTRIRSALKYMNAEADILRNNNLSEALDNLIDCELDLLCTNIELKNGGCEKEGRSLIQQAIEYNIPTIVISGDANITKQDVRDFLKEYKAADFFDKGSMDNKKFDLLVTELLGGIVKAEDEKVLIVTVTRVEAVAVLKVFSEATGTDWKRIKKGNCIYYDIGVLKHTSIYMVQSEMGTATPSGALLTIRQAIQDISPREVIMCGIAFGTGRNGKQKLGDILVAQQLLYYEPQKFDEKLGQVQRGDKVTSSEGLLRKFRSGVLDWKGATIHFGLLLTGEKLVNNPTFKKQLLEQEPEAIGGEMEAAGLYAATHDANFKVDWIVVKAISDWGDGTKNSKSQPLAADNAARFVLHVLCM